jgi:hypothetical protein
MFHNIQKLPIELVFHIISYTYNLQNKNLLHDILNYIETKSKLFECYYHFWNVNNLPEEYNDWLLNDIFFYANDYHPSMSEYVRKFYNIFKRNPVLQTDDDVLKYVYNLEKKDVNTQINILLGLLHIRERNQLVFYGPT